jgi:hypothetical protein
MLIPGVYPFAVFVANVFHPVSNSDEYVYIQVKHYHCPSYTYYKQGSESTEVIIGSDIHPLNETPAQYKIQNGHRVGFSMFVGKESLEISIDPEGGAPSIYPYYIIVGRKAMAKCEDNQGVILNPLGNGTTGSQYITLPEGYYSDAIWKVADSKIVWKLTIKKFQFDPETDDVVIGAGPPA